MVYASTSLALAAIETFVNLEPNLRPADYVSIEGEVSASLAVARLESKRLPNGWRGRRDESLRHFGDEWIERQETVALLVPSAAVSGDWNLLLNPTHPDFAKVRFANAELFTFDVRMFR